MEFTPFHQLSDYSDRALNSRNCLGGGHGGGGSGDAGIDGGSSNCGGGSGNSGGDGGDSGFGGGDGAQWVLIQNEGGVYELFYCV